MPQELNFSGGDLPPLLSLKLDSRSRDATSKYCTSTNLHNLQNFLKVFDCRVT